MKQRERSGIMFKAIMGIGAGILAPINMTMALIGLHIGAKTEEIIINAMFAIILTIICYSNLRED